MQTTLYDSPGTVSLLMPKISTKFHCVSVRQFVTSRCSTKNCYAPKCSITQTTDSNNTSQSSTI